MPFYAVARGRKTGVYNTWEECKKQVDGYSGAKYKKFSYMVEAESFINKENVIGSSGNNASSSSENGSPLSMMRTRSTEFAAHVLSKVENGECSSSDTENTNCDESSSNRMDTAIDVEVEDLDHVTVEQISFSEPDLPCVVVVVEGGHKGIYPSMVDAFKCYHPNAIVRSFNDQNEAKLFLDNCNP